MHQLNQNRSKKVFILLPQKSPIYISHPSPQGEQECGLSQGE